MNVINIVQCSICGAKTNIKTQLGYVNDFYIFVPCLGCKSIINGKCHLEPPKCFFDFDCKVVTNDDIYDFDYYSECSSELVVCKPKTLANKEETHNPIFFKNISLIGKNMNKNPFNLVGQYVNCVKNEWNKNRNLILLYINGKYDLMFKMLEGDKAKSKGNLVFYKHQLYRKTFKLFFHIPSYNLNNAAKEIEKQFLNLDITQIDEIIKVMNQKYYFNELNTKLLDITSKIVDKIPYITPGLFAQFFEKKIDYNEFGISTCTPDQIVDIYKDCYETIAIMIPILEMLNNIKYRGRYDSYTNKKRNIEKSISDTNGNKIKSLNYYELFSSLFCKKLDNCIRNSIGHNNYIYDPITQKITFKDKKVEKEMYLIEFVTECIYIILTLINMENLFFCLERRKSNIDEENSGNFLTECKQKDKNN